MAQFRVTLDDLLRGLRLPTGQRHTVTVTQPRVRRIRLIGMFFDLNKCFLLPSAMRGIRGIKRQYDAHPGGNILIVGHTDTSGSDAYNLTLSLERADALEAYLTDKVAVWEAFFGGGKPAEKRWGLRETQLMLSALPDGKDKFFTGEADGVNDEETRKAVRDFQASKGLKEDGIAGPKTNKALITDYMALDGTSLPPGIAPVTHGCGENFPAKETLDDVRSPDDRRVEIFFFDGPIDPPPPGKTSKRGSTEYPRWVVQATDTVDVVLGTSSEVGTLESRFALDKFEQFADTVEKREFANWASGIYGTDIPLGAYEALYEDLRAKKLEPPPIQLVPGGVDGQDGAYHDATEIIGVDEDLALTTETDAAAAGKLVVVLMHEFGHHVDNILRTRYSRVRGDAQGEEGHLFAYGISAMQHLETDRISFAVLTKAGGSVELALEFPEFHQAAKEYLASPEARDLSRQEGVEYFGAGRGNPKFPQSSFGHRSIEDGLEEVDPVFFNPGIRDQVYFGNWLRDFSQVIDPAWLRVFKNTHFNATAKARELVTEIVDAGAHKDFDNKATPAAHRAGIFRVTTANLGVYRPEEHIDNPEGIRNGAAIDPLFHGPLQPGEIAIDSATGLKAYIKTRNKGFDTAADFVERSLRAALAAGITSEGMRFFGQALHALEDLYAHSNFIELALIRFGHTKVFPWVGELSKVNVTQNGTIDSRFPMVTGMFGNSDMVVSGVSVLGESLQKGVQCENEVFSPASIAVLNLLKAMTPDAAGAIESLFVKAQQLKDKFPDFAEYLCKTTKPLGDYIRAKIGTAIREELNRFVKAEAAFFKDPRATNPTHSMLAKDHDDHPLHVIAAECARELVKDLGIVMRDAWQGSRSADELVQEALKYFVHPNDIELNQSSRLAELMRKIQAFAVANPATISGLIRTSSISRFQRESLAFRKNTLEEASAMYANNEALADRIASDLDFS